jgi:hypothetical protein
VTAARRYPVRARQARVRFGFERAGALTAPATPKASASPRRPGRGMAPGWLYAMQSEGGALMSNGTWVLGSLPAGHTVLPCEWMSRDDASGEPRAALPGGATSGGDAGYGVQPPSLSISGGADDPAGDGVSAGEAQQAPKQPYSAGVRQYRGDRDVVAHDATMAGRASCVGVPMKHGDTSLGRHRPLIGVVLRCMPDGHGKCRVYDTGWLGDGLH